MASWRLYVIPRREGSSIKVPRSEAHSVAQRDLTWRPALLLLTVTDDLGQAQARKRAV